MTLSYERFPKVGIKERELLKSSEVFVALFVALDKDFQFAILKIDDNKIS